jgi:opacity protein-like surface antigen
MNPHSMWKGGLEMKSIARLNSPLAILLFLAAPVFAQDKYRLEIFGSGNFPIDKEFLIGQPQASPAMQASHTYSQGIRGGIRFGVDFKDYWGEDITYSYGSNSSRIINATTGIDFALPLRSHQFAMNALFYPAGLSEGRNVAPYITAGAGATFFVISPSTVNSGMESGLGRLRSENILAFNAGGGVQGQIARHLGIRVDVRDYMSRCPRFGLPEKSDNPNATVFPASGIFHQIEASFGFVFYF